MKKKIKLRIWMLYGFIYQRILWKIDWYTGGTFITRYPLQKWYIDGLGKILFRMSYGKLKGRRDNE